MVHTRLRGWVVSLASILLLIVMLAPTMTEAQIRYRSGQNVAPAYEGW